jgi:hypothetical protein
MGLSRRERQRKQERRQRAQQWADEARRRYPQADIPWEDDDEAAPRTLLNETFVPMNALPKNAPVVLYIRASSKGQRDNVPAQIAHVFECVVKAGLRPVGIHTLIVQGYKKEWLDFVANTQVRYASHYALMEHPDRWVRSPRFGAPPYRDPDAVPGKKQIKHFQEWARSEGIVPVTVYPIYHRLNGLRDSRGRDLHRKNKKDFHKQRKALLLPIVEYLQDLGFTLARIAGDLGLKEDTIKGWIWGGKRG